MSSLNGVQQLHHPGSLNVHVRHESFDDFDAVQKVGDVEGAESRVVDGLAVGSQA